MANRAADRREQFSQRMQALIKVSEFRQIWINRMRDDIAALTSQLIMKKTDVDEECVFKMQRIFLSLNPNEENTRLLRKLVADVPEIMEEDDVDKWNKHVIRMRDLSTVILKDEWKRLKTDLENANSVSEILN